MSWLWNFFQFILPPSDDDGKAAVLRWRYSMAGFTGLFCVHILWSCGWLTWAGFPGNVQASDLNRVEQRVEKVEAKVDEVQAGIIEQSIFGIRSRQCAAIKKGNTDAAKYLSQKLSELLRDYRKLTGADYRLPDCSEV